MFPSRADFARRDRGPDRPRSAPGGPGSPAGARRMAGPVGCTVPAGSRAPMIEAQPIPATTGAGGLAPRPQAWSEYAPWGLSPQQIAAAYGFDAVAFGGIAGDGAGQTIAIVDAYDDPALVDSTSPTSPPATWRSSTGSTACPTRRASSSSTSRAAPPACRASTRRGPACPGTGRRRRRWTWNGRTPWPPAPRSSWSSASRPAGRTCTPGRRWPRRCPGVSVVSMSWGSAEYAGETAYDGDFTTPAGHPGVTFVAATGDDGAPGLYPAYSPNVLAVGGTSLTLQGDGSYGGESGWSDGGGGTSTIEAEPAYQAGVQATGQRTIPDVAIDADPHTGVSVYDSYDDTDGSGPWMKIGGTSLAAPCWAALIAIADQGRVAAGGTTLDGAVAGLAGPLRPAGRRLPRRHHRGQRRLPGRARLRPVHRPGHARWPGWSPRPWPITTWRPGWGSPRARRRSSPPASRST